MLQAIVCVQSASSWCAAEGVRQGPYGADTAGWLVASPPAQHAAGHCQQQQQQQLIVWKDACVVCAYDSSYMQATFLCTMGLACQCLPAPWTLLLVLFPCCPARYALPRERGMLRLLPSPSNVTTRSIVQRIVDNRAAFEARNAKKVASEEAYYSNSKDYVQEL